VGLGAGVSNGGQQIQPRRDSGIRYAARFEALDQIGDKRGTIGMSALRALTRSGLAALFPTSIGIRVRSCLMLLCWALLRSDLCEGPYCQACSPGFQTCHICPDSRQPIIRLDAAHLLPTIVGGRFLRRSGISENEAWGVYKLYKLQYLTEKQHWAALARCRFPAFPRSQGRL
jgi:hypothetical protein